MSNDCLRLGTAADREAVMRLYTSCVQTGKTSWSENYPNDEILDTEINEKWLYLYEENGVLLGTASLLPFDDLEEMNLPFAPTAKPCVLCRLCVPPSHWHTGLGRITLALSEKTAASLGYTAMHLLCNVLLTTPNRLYKAAGYNCIGRVALYGHELWVYEKALDADAPT